jgi:hypothetical protein
MIERLGLKLNFHLRVVSSFLFGASHSPLWDALMRDHAVRVSRAMRAQLNLLSDCSALVG